jgi:uncharacterized lipoprotein YddW (UPF0748 family)
MIFVGLTHQGWSQDAAAPAAPAPAADAQADPAPAEGEQVPPSAEQAVPAGDADMAAADAATTPSAPAEPVFDLDAAEAAALAAEVDQFKPEREPSIAEVIDIKNRRRAIWLDMYGETYNTPAAIELILDNVRKAGFNELFVVVMGEGTTMYPSQFLPSASLVQPEHPDPVSMLITAAREGDKPFKITLVAKPLEAFGSRGLEAAPLTNILKKNPAWLCVNESGNSVTADNTYLVDPAIPAVHDYTALLVRELAERYPQVDGFQLHNIRYPGYLAQWGYSETTVAAFNAETGGSGTPSPEDQSWQEWRRERITALLTRLTESIKAAAPRAVVSATCHAHGRPAADQLDWVDSASYAGALQDWLTWDAEQIVDELVILNFQSEQFDVGFFERWLGFIENNIKNTPYIIGVGKSENFAEEVMAQIREALLGKCKGVALFSYQEPNIEDIRTTLFFTLGRQLFNEEYSGLRLSNIRIDPEFADLVPQRDAAAPSTRSRADIDIPAEFNETPMFPGGEEAAPEATTQPTVTDENEGQQPAVTAAPLLPDVIYLKSGGILRGRIIDETASTVQFRHEAGFEMTVDRERIQEIRYADR